MSKDGPMPDDDLQQMLVQRAPRARAKSTTILIALIILVVGMIIGVGLGRASVQIEQTISEGGGQQGPQRPPPAFEGN